MSSNPRQSVSLHVVAPLLDDESPVTQEALLALFGERSGEAIPFLQGILVDASEEAQRQGAKRYLDMLVGPDTLSEFRAFLEAQRFELETGAILLHRVVDPKLEAGEVCGTIDAIAQRCLQLVARPATTREICRVINRVIYHEWEFRGDEEDFENPDNSLIGEVLRRRRGLPITLGALYLLVARRVGLEFEPICLPGRFMIAHFGGIEPLYIDAFDGGRMRSLDEVADFLRENQLPAGPADFAPASTPEVLARMCRNLMSHFHARGQDREASIFAELAEACAHQSSAE